MHVIKKILILSVSFSFAFAGNFISEESIKNIKVGEKLPKEIKGDWKEFKESSVIAQYSKSTDSGQTGVIDTKNEEVVFKKYSEVKGGLIDPEFQKIQGELEYFSARLFIKNSNLGEKVVLMPKDNLTHKEVYENLISEAKNQILVNKEVKAEIFASFKSNGIKIHKKITSIFLSPENIESSLVYFEEKDLGGKF